MFAILLGSVEIMMAPVVDSVEVVLFPVVVIGSAEVVAAVGVQWKQYWLLLW